MTTAYATVAEFKAMSKMAQVDKDAAIQLCLEAASLAIDGFCNRKDGFVATAPLARSFASAGRNYVSCDECIAVALVEELNDGAWVALGPDAWVAFSGDVDEPLYAPPFEAVMKVDGPFPAGKLARVRITAEWGVSESAPAMVKTAALAQATKWFKRFEGAFATTLANNNLGRKAFVQALDPDVEFMLVSAPCAPSLVRKDQHALYQFDEHRRAAPLAQHGSGVVCRAERQPRQNQLCQRRARARN